MDTPKYTHHPAGSYKQLHQLRQYVKGTKGFIAGGCFKNIFLNQPIRDIDVFFDCVEDFDQAVKKYAKDKKYKKIYENDNCIGYRNKETKVTVELVRSLLVSCESTLDRFDFTIVKAAYILPKGKEEYQFVYHPKFFEHLMLGKLVIDEHIEKPVATFNRALKYAKYGFGLCLESKQVLTKEVIERGDVSQLTNDLYFGFD